MKKTDKQSKVQLAKRMSAYTLVATGALAVSSDAEAGVIYTNVDPDTTVDLGNSQVFLDIDGDGNPDVGFTAFGTTYYGYNLGGIYAINNPGYSAVAGDIFTSGSYSVYTPYKLQPGDTVGNNLAFNAGSQGAVGLSFAGLYSYGNWSQDTAKYVGVRFLSATSGQEHFGWVRLSTNIDDTNPRATILAYAFEDTPNTPIEIPVLRVTATDVSDNGNGTDMEVSFPTPTTYEDSIAEFRVIVVKDAAAAGFDLADAQAVASANYTVVDTGQAVNTLTLGSGATDTDGDAIANGVPYKVFVLIKGFNEDELSLPADITLFLELTSFASAPALADVADNGTAADLQISFTKAPDETLVFVYGVVLIKEANAAAFGLAELAVLPQSRIIPVFPTGSDVTQTLLASVVDTDGDAVVTGVPYVIKVATIGTTITGPDAVITGPSNAVTLNLPTGVETLEAIEGLDMYSFGNQVHINVRSTDLVGKQLQVITLAGQQIQAIKLEEGKQVIDLGKVPGGIYLGVVEQNGATLTTKLYIGQ